MAPYSLASSEMTRLRRAVFQENRKRVSASAHSQSTADKKSYDRINHLTEVIGRPIRKKRLSYALNEEDTLHDGRRIGVIVEVGWE